MEQWRQHPLALACTQVGRLFATVERGSPSKLALTTDVPAGFDQALYFVRDVEQLCLPENIQVKSPSVLPAIVDSPTCSQWSLWAAYLSAVP